MHCDRDSQEDPALISALHVTNIKSDNIFSGGKVVQEYQVRFDATFSKVVTLVTQSNTKYDEFLEEYPCWLC